MKLCQWTNGPSRHFDLRSPKVFLFGPIWILCFQQRLVLRCFEMFLPAAFFLVPGTALQQCEWRLFFLQTQVCRGHFGIWVLYIDVIHCLAQVLPPQKKDLTSSLRSMAANSDDEMPQSPRHVTIKVHRLSGEELFEIYAIEPCVT